MVQITDENEQINFVRTGSISGEFDIVIDVMDDVKDDQLKVSRMLNYAQVVSGTPMEQSTDWALLNKELSQKIMGTSKFVVDRLDSDAEENAMVNLVGMLQNGERPVFSEGVNLKKHLEIYESERRRWTGLEDRNPNVEGVLDPVIDELKERAKTPAGQQTAPPVGGNEAIRQELSGQLGGI